MAATHIGCLVDIPARSLNWLKNADLLIFEEDRPAKQVLKAAKVQRDYLKFNEHYQKETLEKLKECLQKQGIALYMSDQGTPNLADPGKALLNIAYQLNAQVVVIPGPSSITAAIAACPFDLSQFSFAGFLPRIPAEREQRLSELRQRREALVIMDTPYRLKALLAACKAVFPNNHRAFLAIDITGENEEYIAGSFTALQKKAENVTKLNFVLIVEG